MKTLKIRTEKRSGKLYATTCWGRLNLYPGFAPGRYRLCGFKIYHHGTVDGDRHVCLWENVSVSPENPSDVGCDAVDYGWREFVA